MFFQFAHAQEFGRLIVVPRAWRGGGPPFPKKGASFQVSLLAIAPRVTSLSKVTGAVRSQVARAGHGNSAVWSDGSRAACFEETSGPTASKRGIAIGTRQPGLIVGAIGRVG